MMGRWRISLEVYRFDSDSIHSLNRKAQTTIFRLRIGHCRLRKHMEKIGLTDTAECQCGAAEQTSLHILQLCPLYDELRASVWKNPTPVNTKLWGSATDLLKTANFVATTDLEI